MPAPTPAGLGQFQRHMLVWLRNTGWEAALRAAAPSQQSALMLWQRHDWPVVVRRGDPGASCDDVALGLALPPAADSGHKLRIALSARQTDIRHCSAALALRPALQHAGVWHTALAALEHDAAPLTLRVYGSLALQTLTGLSYLNPRSDIDVLCHPSSVAELDAILALLTRYSAVLPLDGEIVFPGGLAVAWKEWQLASVQRANVLVKVLVKTCTAVKLVYPATLLATLEQTC